MYKNMQKGFVVRKAFRDIAIIVTAIVLMFGALGIALNLQAANGMALIAIIMFGIGGALLAYLVKKEIR